MKGVIEWGLREILLAVIIAILVFILLLVFFGTGEGGFLNKIAKGFAGIFGL